MFVPASTASTSYAWLLGIIPALVGIALTIHPPRRGRGTRTIAGLLFVLAVELLALPLSISTGVSVALGVAAALVVTRWSLRSAQTPQPPSEAADGYVGTEHRDFLKQMLGNAFQAVASGSARSPYEPLQETMLAAHFAALVEPLNDWNAVVERRSHASAALRNRFREELASRDLDAPPLNASLTVEGLARITEMRALRGELDTPLPPAVGEPPSVWQAFANDHHGTISFSPWIQLGLEIVADFLRGPELQGEAALHAYIDGLLDPVHGVLLDAQPWPEALEIPEARDALETFDKTSLIEQIRREQVVEQIPRAAGCPACRL